tara:strand:- start:6886 stop:7119 length:234 start_codon:yes stop_codon:yes gene_type:complete
MIIPVKCFTCGNVLGDKYLYYIKKVNDIKVNNGMKGDEVVYLTPDNIKKTPEGIVMDELRLRKMCCRRHMLTHIDIM